VAEESELPSSGRFFLKKAKEGNRRLVTIVMSLKKIHNLGNLGNQRGSSG